MLEQIKKYRFFQIILGIMVEISFFFCVYLAGYFLSWLLYKIVK